MSTIPEYDRLRLMGYDDVTGCRGNGGTSTGEMDFFFFCCLERVVRRDIQSFFFSFSYLGWERRRIHQVVTTDTASAVT